REGVPDAARSRTCRAGPHHEWARGGPCRPAARRAAPAPSRLPRAGARTCHRAGRREARRRPAGRGRAGRRCRAPPATAAPPPRPGTPFSARPPPLVPVPLLAPPGAGAVVREQAFARVVEPVDPGRVVERDEHALRPV